MAPPRKYPPGQAPTAADRVKLSESRKMARGERRVVVWLDKEHYDELVAIAGQGSLQDAIRALIRAGF